MIVPTHVPKRTTLALKNRYTALCTKANQVQSPPTFQMKPKTSSRRSSSKGCLDQPRLNASKARVMFGLEAEDQTDEDDEDEDEDQENHNDEYEAMDAVNFLDMDWQEGLPSAAATTQRQTSSSQLPNQSASGFLPTQGEAQQLFNPLLAATEQWDKEVCDSATYFGTMPLSFDQSSFAGPSSHASPLPDMNPHSTASPTSFQQCRQPYNPDLPQISLHTHSPAGDLAADILTNSTSRMSPEKTRERLADGEIPLPVSRPSSSRASIGRRYRPEGHSSPVKYQTVIDQPQARSLSSRSAATERAMTLPSSRPAPPSTIPSNSSDSLCHISIDATCTAEQVGNLMQAVVGLAKSVTVKVKP